MAKKQAAKAEAIIIPQLQVSHCRLKCVGTTPLLVNNKMGVAAELAEVYGKPGGKTGSVTKVEKVAPEVAYKRAFYVMPSSKYEAPDPRAKYGIPASGMKKCWAAAVRMTGISANATIGVIQRSFQIAAIEGGLIPIEFDHFEMDVRPAAIGEKNKVPDMRYRPMFHGWSCVLDIDFNPAVMTIQQLVNLGMHAGFYIGWGELRAQLMQGECGGFVVETLFASKTVARRKKVSKRA